MPRRDSGYGSSSPSSTASTASSSTSSSSSTVPLPSTASSPSTAPSYLRPTAASSNRKAGPTPPTKLPTNTATVAGVKYHYVDGCISKQRRMVDEIGYYKHTLASSEKTVDQFHAQEHGITFTTKLKKKNAAGDEVDLWAYSEEPYYEDVEDDPGDDLNFILDRMDPVQTQTLKQRTRFRDSFYSTPAGEVHIRFNRQLYYLQMAYVHAQDTLWHCLRQDWPDAQKLYYRQDPRSVRFGREELNSTITSDTRYKLRPEAHQAIMYVVHLRNAIAHPYERSCKLVDELMQEAQSMACWLGDEPRAMKIRGLRDEVQRLATRTYKAIVAYEPLCQLPQPRVEPLHHQEHFNSVGRELHFAGDNRPKIIARFGPEVVRVVEHWQLRRIKPGHVDPEYIANLAKYNDARVALEAREKADAEARLQTTSSKQTATM